MNEPVTEEPPVSVRSRTGTGPADGRPRMLLLHGLAANDSLWDRCADLLPTEYQVWTAQLPWRGEGMADWGLEGGLTERLSEALCAVPGGAEVVVAHSMSANVLLELLDQAVRRGEDPFARHGIRALVLVSPFYRASAEEFDWETLSYYLNDFHLIMEEGIRVHSAGRFPADIQAAMGQRVRDRVGPYGWIRFFDMYLRTPRLRTAHITVPTLVIGGTRDFAAPVREGAALAGALPDARRCELPGSGHFPMIEEAERFASTIRAFVHPTADGDPQRGADALSTLELHR